MLREKNLKLFKAFSQGEVKNDLKCSNEIPSSFSTFMKNFNFFVKNNIARESSLNVITDTNN